VQGARVRVWNELLRDVDDGIDMPAFVFAGAKETFAVFTDETGLWHVADVLLDTDGPHFHGPHTEHTHATFGALRLSKVEVGEAFAFAARHCG
jgi:hypothetical protein